MPIVESRSDPVSPPYTPEQEERLRSYGPGSLADYAKQTYNAGLTIPLAIADLAMTGPGSAQDAFKWRLANPVEPPPGGGSTTPLYVAPIVSIGNQNLPYVELQPTDAPFYTLNSTVSFDGTGIAQLDAPGATFQVIEVLADYGSYFPRIGVDLSLEPAPSITGNINLLVAGTRVKRETVPMAADLAQAIRESTGSLADYAKQAFAAGEPFLISRSDAAAMGSGSIQDGLRTALNEHKG